MINQVAATAPAAESADTYNSAGFNFALEPEEFER
jgi:hypothetical protein